MTRRVYVPPYPPCPPATERPRRPRWERWERVAFIVLLSAFVGLALTGFIVILAWGIQP